MRSSIGLQYREGGWRLPAVGSSWKREEGPGASSSSDAARSSAEPVRLQELVAAPANDAESKARKAVALCVRKEFVESSTVAQAALLQDQNCGRAHYALAWALHELEQDGAVQHADLAAVLEPQDAAIRELQEFLTAL